jgi:putative transposase
MLALMTIPLPLQFFFLLLAGWVSRHQAAVIEYLKEENRVLRELHGKKRLQFTDKQRRRLAVKGKALGSKLLGEIGSLVTPDTILGWYRRLVATKYDGSKRRRPGRPRTVVEIADLVVRIAQENPGFGYTRIRDALHNLKIDVGRSTVKRILDERGIMPAPERSRRGQWATFLKAHWGAIAAADFFTVEVLTWSGLVRYHVFFVMDLKTRRVEIAGITCDPCGRWMKQMARNLTDAFEGFLLDKRHLILDRDPLYTAAFRGMLDDFGVNTVRLPRRSPNLNSHCERFILSIRRECLNRLVLLGESHLRSAVSQFVAHYHGERNHQGLGSDLIEPGPELGRAEGRIACRVRLGGLLKYYYRDAA